MSAGQSIGPQHTKIIAVNAVKNSPVTLQFASAGANA